MDLLPQLNPNATGPQFPEQIFRSAGAGSRPRPIRLTRRSHRRYPALCDAAKSEGAAEPGAGKTLTQSERDGAGCRGEPRSGAPGAAVQTGQEGQPNNQPNPESDARHTVGGAVARIGREPFPPGSPGVER